MKNRLLALVYLRDVHKRLVEFATRLSDAELRTQYHPDLSALGWHLAHCEYVENHWLRETLQGQKKFTKKDNRHFMPENLAKPKRGKVLLPKAKLLAKAELSFENNILLLSGTAEELNENHPLMEEEYVIYFLVQHHAQHLETMSMILSERAIQRHQFDFHPETQLKAAPADQRGHYLRAGTYPIGGGKPLSFDNELPHHDIHLQACEIAQNPVTNAQFLAFIEADGYQNRDLWSTKAQAWLAEKQFNAPHHWRQDSRGWWYGLDLNGPSELDANSAVSGLSWFEAQAYANWANARLPHEQEWETAHRLNLISGQGSAWEWCGNPFYPYEGFEPFTYDNYSKPWFDGEHYSLRGNSCYTRPVLKRHSFRNFYTADKRHIFAGLRLAFDV